MKLIEFISPDKETMALVSGFSHNSLPHAAKENIPDWYKATPKFIPNESKIDSYGDPNTTVRNCMPFLDLMTAGYHLPLPCDVWIERKGDYTSIKWSQDELKLFTPHDVVRSTTIPIEEGYDKVEFKIINPWIVRTPKGYSTIFQSPFGHDIPFKSVPAIVDTDEFPLPVNIPIMIKKNFEGFIPKGTPFVQVIPFKREEWTSGISIDDGTLKNKWNNAQQNFFDRYRKFFRSKKVFKCPFHV